MSMNWSLDMHKMHDKYGVTKTINEMDSETLTEFIKFRAACIQEEVDEFTVALKDNDPEEMVDALIDVCVFAIGTLDIMGVDANAAWEQVLSANMNKEVGTKPGRPNPLGLPDLLKPSGWTPPEHTNNHGKFTEVNYAD